MILFVSGAAEAGQFFCVDEGYQKEDLTALQGCYIMPTLKKTYGANELSIEPLNCEKQISINDSEIGFYDSIQGRNVFHFSIARELRGSGYKIKNETANFNFGNNRYQDELSAFDISYIGNSNGVACKQIKQDVLSGTVSISCKTSSASMGTAQFKFCNYLR